MDKTRLLDCTLTLIEFDRTDLPGAHRIEFKDSDDQLHSVVMAFDPIITHASAPKNRLHRWLIQPGVRCSIVLPQSNRAPLSPGLTAMEIRIDHYADSQYIPGVYTNHEGKRELRTMVPLRVRLEETKWHGLAHTITGWDKDRQAERTYALGEWDFTQAGRSNFEDNAYRVNLQAQREGRKP